MFGKRDKFDPNTDVPNLSGKVYVVTGGSAGIGFGISAHILQHGCSKLFLLGRKEEHLAEAEEGLKKYGDTSRLELIQVDFGDIRQTDQVAKQLASRLERLDALILNAGLGVGPYSLTKDGLESHMQVNVFAQYHLTTVLLPKLISSPESRLCFQSSEYHRLGTGDVHFRDISEINNDMGASTLYARSKLALVLLCRALYRRKVSGALGLQPGAAPYINATHPGAVVTDQQDQAIEAYGTLGKTGVKAIRPFMKDPVDEGCRTMLFAATSPDIVEDGIDGEYIVPDCKVTNVSDQGKDEELGERLWELTESILREKLKAP
ncbi:putative NAD(P)-binding protein [Seiridium cardinale]|uniref:NAD(P)-binding protein n=1 Tax=Seiridium cardinale TaxID=138064 RepID=A0ABR2YA55_9PEZI